MTADLAAFIRRYRWDLVGLAGGIAALLIAFGTRTRTHDFWLDEMVTYTLVRDPSVSHMVAAVMDGAENNPPLYHLLLRPWVALFGASPLALRLPTALAFCAALVFCWVAVRRVYPLRAVAVGTFAAFAGSSTLIRTEIASARFYGVYTMLAAAALALAVPLSTSEKPRARLLVAAWLVNVLLVYNQVFGLLFSGALFAGTLAAQLVWDRVRWRSLAPYLASWAAFVPWIPSMLHQAELAKPHNWIQVPGMKDLFNLVSSEALFLPYVLVAIVLLRAFDGPIAGGQTAGADTADATAAGSPDLASVLRRRVLLTLSTAYLLVPVLMFAVSHAGTSVFVPRYMLPALLGWAAILAEVGTGPRDSCAASGAGTRSSFWHVTRWGGLSVLLLLAAVALSHIKPQADEHAIDTLAMIRGTQEPVVVESGFTFWPQLQVPRPARSNVVYVLDSAVAFERGPSVSAIQEFKLARVYAQHGYLEGSVVDGAHFVCTHSRFYVVDDPAYLWFERRVRPDSAGGATWTDGEKVGGAILRHVTLSPAAQQRHCAAASAGAVSSPTRRS